MSHAACKMTSLINKSADWSPPNNHKTVNTLTLNEPVKITHTLATIMVSLINKSADWGCLPEGHLPEGCLPMGVSAGGCVARGRG